MSRILYRISSLYRAIAYYPYRQYARHILKGYTFLHTPEALNEGSNFSFLVRRFDGVEYVVKIENPLFRLYHETNGRSRVSISERARIVTELRGKSKLLEAALPEVFVVGRCLLSRYKSEMRPLSVHISPARAGLIAETIKHLVDEWHSHGYTHGDLKAKNILVAQDALCLIDFDDVQRLSPATLAADQSSLGKLLAVLSQSADEEDCA